MDDTTHYFTLSILISKGRIEDPPQAEGPCFEVLLTRLHHLTHLMHPFRLNQNFSANIGVSLQVQRSISKKGHILCKTTPLFHKASCILSSHDVKANLNICIVIFCSFRYLLKANYIIFSLINDFIWNNQGHKMLSEGNNLMEFLLETIFFQEYN